MARSVGEIEVTVEADTGRLKAQLKKDAKIAGEAAAAEIEKQLSRLEAEIGRVDVDRAAAEKAARLLRRQIEAKLKGIDVDVDFAQAKRELREFEAEMEARDIAMSAELSERDVARINQNLREMREKAEANEIQLQVDLQTGLAQAEIEAFHRKVEETSAVRLAIDTAKAAAELAFFRQRQEADDIELEVEIKRDRLDQSLDALGKKIADWATDSGEGAGDRFSSGFGGGFSGDDTMIILAAIAAAGDAAAQALSGGLAAATSLVSSAVAALGSAAGAAVPLMTSLGVSMGAVAVGSAGLGDALGLVNEEFAAAEAAGRPLNRALLASSATFRELSPAARDTALAYADIRDELAAVQDEVSQEVFAGMGDVLREIGEDVLPGVSEGLQIAGASANEFGRELAGVLGSINFEDLARRLDPALDDVFDALVAVVDTMQPFLRTAAPAAERLAEMLERGAEGLSRWFSFAGNQRKFSDFLDDGLTSLRRWTQLIQSLGDLLTTVFSAGQESGDDFVVSLNNIIERWDAFLESTQGQAALADWFDSGRAAMEALKPVLDGLKEAFDILVTPEAMSNFEDLAEAIGRALPALAELLALSGQLQLGAAFANLLTILGPVFELLTLIPDPMLEIVGAAIVLYGVFKKVSVAVKALEVAFQAISKLALTNPWWFALAAGLTVAIAAMDAFTGKQRKASEVTREFQRALQDSVDTIITSGEVAAGAEIGIKAMTDALGNTEGADKLQKALGVLNQDMGDSAEILIGIDQDAQKALTGLAQSFGLPAEEAAALAKIVNETDDNFKMAESSGSRLGKELAALGESSGLTHPEMLALAKALEEAQDQAENIDFEKVATDELAMAKGGTEAEQSALRLAKANQEAGDVAAGVLPLYQEYLRLLNEQANASDDSTSAAGRQASSYELVTEAIENALASQEERRQALVKEGQAAFEASKKEELLAETTKAAAEELAVGRGFSQEFAEGLINIGEAADEAAESASALTESFDTLFGRSVDSQAAFDSFYQTISDLNEQLAESGDSALPKVGSALEAVFGTTEAALGFREAMRGGVEEMLAYAEAATNAGTPSADINAKIAAMRDTLVATGTQFGLTSEDVDSFISTLMGTPELVSTIISTPGMIDALLNATDLKLLYDSAGNPVITEFQAQGIDPAMADVEGFRTLVDGLNQTRGEPTIGAPTIPEVQGDVEGLQTGVDDLDATNATPTVALPSADTVARNIDTLQRKFDTLDRTDARPTVAVSGAAVATTAVNNVQTAIRNLVGKTVRVDVTGAVQAKTEVDNLRESIRLLSDKTVTIRTNTVGAGAMAGRIVTGPSLVPVGERGYAEAIVPLQLPLSRVDPSVRELAAMLRGDERRPVTTTGVQRIINNTLNITPQSADPVAVANQVINRAAAMSR